MAEATVRLEPWAEGDLPLLRRLMGDPAMTKHLGGPESEEKLVERQDRYERLDDRGKMFKIVDADTGEALGSVGYREKDWRDQQVYETGWSVLPERQVEALPRPRRGRRSTPPEPNGSTGTYMPSPPSTTRRRTRSAASSASRSWRSASSSTRRGT